VQSYILDGLLKKHGSSLNMILEIDVPTLDLITRLDARSKTERCMPYDSSLPKIVKRLQEHETKTIPVIEKYKHLHGVERIDGRGSFEEVAARVSAVVDNAFKGMR
jgi:adenylate kinase